MSEPAIEIHNLSKMYRLFRRSRYRVLDLLGFRVPKSAYSEFWALHELNLTIPAGQRVGIIGRNGAGKSTLLKLVAGLLQPTGGSLAVRGQIQTLMELGTGFHPEFTGRQNVYAALSYQGVTGREAHHRFAEIVRFAELEDFIDNPLKTYSSGMQTRLSFAVATSIKPEILIIDEVLGAGDAYFIGKSQERMKQLTESSGTTVLFVSHDLGSVQQICNRVIWIDRGRIVADGPPLEVTKVYYASILKQEEERLKARNARLGLPKAPADQTHEAAPTHELAGRLNNRLVITPESSSSPPAEHDEPLLKQKSTDYYYSDYADFSRIKIMDRAGQARVIFRLNEPVIIMGEASIAKPIPTCGFSLTIYNLSGVVAANLFWPFAGGLAPGQSSWQVLLPTPHLRQDEYLISCGIIKEFVTATNATVQFYCRWSRALSFRVDESFIGNMPLGLVLMETDPPQGAPLPVSRSTPIMQTNDD